MITISLCMIVKNEEAVLARCLDSIADLMDEIIIVDTGSTDRTKEIAANYTDKIYDFQWMDDFAAARNFSFSKASMEYIYTADADEWMDDKNRKLFFQMKQVLLPEIEIVQMKYANQLAEGTTYNFDVEYRGKLYKRLREFVWINAIHETVNIDPVVYNSEIQVVHLPTSLHADRDFAAFERLWKRGVRLSRKLHSLYARELYIAGEKKDFLASEEYFLTTMTEENRGLEEIKESSCVLARIYRLKGDVGRFFKYAMKDFANEPSSEICYELGEYYFSEEDYEEAAIWYYNGAYEAGALLNIHYMGEYPLYRLAECYEHLGNKQQSDFYNQQAAEWKAPQGNDI